MDVLVCKLVCYNGSVGGSLVCIMRRLAHQHELTISLDRVMMAATGTISGNTDRSEVDWTEQRL